MSGRPAGTLMQIDRRALLTGMAAASLALAGCARAAPGAADRHADKALREALAALETRAGGRIGIGLLDGRDGTLTGHRIDERFTMCSTFKLSLAALLLARIDAGAFARDATLPIGRDDPVGHAPVVRAALDRGEASMGVLALAQAAQEQSDNGAANILLRALGGPAALTAFWRSLGDRTSRLDRYEPALNTSHDSDPRDTTTPAAMARALLAILAGPTLKPASRALLIGWTVATQTGLTRLRGGLPPDWRAGDKTGTMTGATYPDKINDVAIVWHPKRAEPFILTGFLETAGMGKPGAGPRPEDEAALAEAGRLAARWIETRIG